MINLDVIVFYLFISFYLMLRVVNIFFLGLAVLKATSNAMLSNDRCWQTGEFELGTVFGGHRLQTRYTSSRWNSLPIFFTLIGFFNDDG